MPRSQRHVARIRRSTAASKEPRLTKQKPPAAAEPASPDARIMRLQQAIGNHAVQRLIQREPKGGTKQKALPGVVAKIVLESGDLDGRSQVPGHEGEVEFFSLSSSVSLSPEGALVELHFSRPNDAASVALSRALVNGERIVSARFHFIKPADDGGVDTVFTMELVNGYVTSLSIADNGQGAAIDDGSFQFEKPR